MSQPNIKTGVANTNRNQNGARDGLAKEALAAEAAAVMEAIAEITQSLNIHLKEK